MRRREALVLFGGAVLAMPTLLRAQALLPVIGFLGASSPELWAARLKQFHRGLSDTGFVEGRNVAIEYRWADGVNDRLAQMAVELAMRNVQVIVAGGSQLATLAAKAATKTIPIVFNTSGDPVALGIVANLARPEGNLTGVASVGAQLVPKQFELMRELVPSAKLFAALVNPTSPSRARTLAADARSAAQNLGVELQVLEASSLAELHAAFGKMRLLKPGALLVGADSFFTSHAKEIAQLAIADALPAIYWAHDFTDAGGLMSYGTSSLEPWPLVGAYAGRILKGERPAELPVQQATRLELIINLNTARLLGLTIPPALLGRADGLIE